MSEPREPLTDEERARARRFHEFAMNTPSQYDEGFRETSRLVVRLLYECEALRVKVAELSARLNALSDTGSSPEEQVALLRDKLAAAEAELARWPHRWHATLERRKVEGELAEARELLRRLLLSADASWEEGEQGHDWSATCEDARAYLARTEPSGGGGQAARGIMISVLDALCAPPPAYGSVRLILDGVADGLPDGKMRDRIRAAARGVESAITILRTWLESQPSEEPNEPSGGGRDARPRIVCLCGSTRFWQTFAAEGLRLTLEGKIVLSIGIAAPDSMVLAHPDTAEGRAQKTALDVLHKRKIDLADEVLVLNVGGYIGESTRSEIEYARAHGKPVRFLEGEPDGGGRA